MDAGLESGLAPVAERHGRKRRVFRDPFIYDGTGIRSQSDVGPFWNLRRDSSQGWTPGLVIFPGIV
jgi:hypothetical protein